MPAKPRHALSLLLCLFVVGCSKSDSQSTAEAAGPRLHHSAPASAAQPREQRLAMAFRPLAGDGTVTLRVEEIAIPAFPGASAIWGALGRDDRGHIWFGVSSDDPDRAARLFEYQPHAHRLTDHGDVVERLREAGQFQDGLSQSKIHSRLHQAEDGYLYFTSMDESGENASTGHLPGWGSHLWRIHPQSGRWEHLHQVPEGLIALNGAGPWVYALGYWDHVLYQYDIRSGRLRSTRVGAGCGHVSRNFLVDLRGHAYVPRVAPTTEEPTSGTCASEAYRADLVELDTELLPVASTPLDDYLVTKRPGGSHGITAFSVLQDASLVFLTHGGRLYHLLPLGEEPALVLTLDYLHPQGRSYTASLFSPDGRDQLAGVGRTSGADTAWIYRNLRSGRRALTKLDLPPARTVLLYGSMIRDQEGDFYVGGRIQELNGRSRPLLLRLRAQAANGEQTL